MRTSMLNLSFCSGVDADADRSFPWISSVLFNRNGVSARKAHFCIACNEEVDVNRIRRLSIDVTSQRSHKAHHIRWAAGNVNPIEAFVVAKRAQRILIEEAISPKRNASCQAVVKD